MLFRSEARKAAIKISDGSFGLDDFLDQLQQVRKLGPMKNLLGMIPAERSVNYISIVILNDTKSP